jgi:hypothetical protein
MISSATFGFVPGPSREFFLRPVCELFCNSFFSRFLRQRVAEVMRFFLVRVRGQFVRQEGLCFFQRRPAFASPLDNQRERCILPPDPQEECAYGGQVD